MILSKLLTENFNYFDYDTFKEYEEWKKTDVAQKFLNAYIKLKKAGDQSPLTTLERMVRIDFPIKFIKEYAIENGILPDTGIRSSFIPAEGLRSYVA